MNLKWTLLIHSFSRPKMNLKWTWNEPQLSFASFTCEEEQRRVKVMQLVYPSRLRLRSISTASMLIHGHYRHRKRTYQELLLAKQRCFDPKRTPSGIICRACCIDEGWNDENLYNLKVSQPIQIRFGMRQQLPKVHWHTKSHPDWLRNSWVLGLGPSHQAGEAFQMGSEKWMFWSLEATVLIVEQWALDML